MTDAREIIALQEFAKWAIREGAFQGADLDGLSIQEKAHELGLIEATTYDPGKHGPSDVAEAGDEWFTFSPILTTAGFRIIGKDEVDQVTVGWQPIKTVPTPPARFRINGLCADYDKLTWFVDGEPTHWMPFPTAPAAIRAIGRKA